MVLEGNIDTIFQNIFNWFRGEIMRLTRFSDYAFRVLIHAAKTEDEMITIEQTAEFHGISRMHLMKVVNLLIKEGFLKGVRGRNGGFHLAREPEEINLGAVLRVTEPDFQLADCFESKNKCQFSQKCGLSLLMKQGLSQFIAIFDQRTLADIL